MINLPLCVWSWSRSPAEETHAAAALLPHFEDAKVGREAPRAWLRFCPNRLVFMLSEAHFVLEDETVLSYNDNEGIF